MFNADEVSAIEDLAEQARAQGQDRRARTLEGLLVKLRTLAAEPAGSTRLELFEEVLPLAGEAAEPTLASRVRRALDRQEPIRIRYRANRDDQVTTRRIRPFNIHFYDGREYVEAFCELRGADRIFALDNIEEVLEELPAPATVPDEAETPAGTAGAGGPSP